MARRAGLALLVIGLLMGAAPASAQLPTSEDCASGQADPVALGEHVGSAAVCASADGHVVAYAGGNALIPCGSITLADAPVASDDPNFCDSLLELPVPDELEYEAVLPSDYETSGRSYPVLYLLTSGLQDEWPTVDPNLQDVADLGVIIVLPARGFGFYNDWHNGEHNFETLYTRTLIDHVDSHYRTIPNRTQRALAGVSKAGYGAMLFAARHPDMYAAAASFSGILDIARPGFPATFTAQLAAGFATYDEPTGAVDNPIWGNPATEEVRWHNKNPTDLATNLRGIALYASAGDGTPTPDELQQDGPTVALGSQPEVEVRLQSDNFDQALTREGIGHTYIRHAGTHNFRFWVPELHEWARTMMSVFAQPVEPPTAFDYRSADPAFSVWGWRFQPDPERAMEFLQIDDASGDGLVLTGSGTTTVETAPLFSPGQSVRVADDTGRSESVTADSEGRLQFSANLGRAHEAQQYRPEARALEAQPGYFTTRRITFASETG